MFRGNSPTRVEDSGRFKIPETFRKEFPEGQKFYITSLDGEKALVYPIAEWLKKEEAVGRLPSTHPARTKFEDRVGYYGDTVEMDKMGRLVLPQVLREKAELKGEVVVIGKIGTLEPGILEVVNLEKFKAKLEAQPITHEDLAALAEAGI